MAEIMPKKSISGKFARYLLVFLVLFLFSGIAAIYMVKEEFQQLVVSFQNYKIKETAEAIDNTLQSTIDDLKSFYVLKDDLAKKDYVLTTTHIYQLFLIDQNIDSVRIIDPAGLEVLGVSRTNIAMKNDMRDLREAPYFKIAKAGKIYIGDVYIEGQDIYIDVAVPYFENFKLIAVVFARINLKDYFGDLATKEELGSGYMHVLDKNGIILASLNVSAIGKDVSGSPFFLKIRDQNASVTELNCDECMEAGEKNLITSAQRITNSLGLYVVMESDKDKALAFYYQERNIFALTFGMVVIFYIVLVWMLGTRFRRYFAVLIDGINRFNRGDYTEKIELKTDDELEYIAEHINHFVTEIEKSREEQKKTLTLLSHVDTVKYNFIKTISHQLRTPVTSMLWLLENLTSQIAGSLTAEQDALFKNIYKAIQGINDIINDMILVLDIEDKKIGMETAKVNLIEILNSALKNMQPLANERGIKLISKHPLDTTIEGVVDGKKLLFVLKELLENALIYSPEHADKEIVAGLDVHGEQAIFFVSDQGIGIPSAEWEHLYDKFYRASNAYQLFQNASGLGLYIIRAFVELHGGKIWFDSQEGVGTNFYFSIPLKSEKGDNKK